MTSDTQRIKQFSKIFYQLVDPNRILQAFSENISEASIRMKISQNTTLQSLYTSSYLCEQNFMQEGQPEENVKQEDDQSEKFKIFYSDGIRAMRLFESEIYDLEEFERAGKDDGEMEEVAEKIDKTKDRTNQESEVDDKDESSGGQANFDNSKTTFLLITLMSMIYLNHRC